MVGTSMAGEAERGPVGYFALDANGINRDFLERLVLYSWAKLYVGGATVAFLQSIPDRIVVELEVANEPDEEVLGQLAELRGHRWLVLSDGNPGDQRFYFFPGAS